MCNWETSKCFIHCWSYHKERKSIGKVTYSPRIKFCWSLEYTNIFREYNQAVSEFIEGGDLRSVLRNSPYTFQDEITSRERTGGQNVDAEVFDTISTSDLFSFAYQIANGMEYLASLPVRYLLLLEFANKERVWAITLNFETRQVLFKISGYFFPWQKLMG